LHFGDKKTDRRTDALSRSRSRERRLNKLHAVIHEPEAEAK